MLFHARIRVFRYFIICDQLYLNSVKSELKYKCFKVGDYSNGYHWVKLRENDIESNQVYFRNDRYSIFKDSANNCYPNMDSLENNYLVLPLHTKMTEDNEEKICSVIKSGW